MKWKSKIAIMFDTNDQVIWKKKLSAVVNNIYKFKTKGKKGEKKDHIPVDSELLCLLIEISGMQKHHYTLQKESNGCVRIRVVVWINIINSKAHVCNIEDLLNKHNQFQSSCVQQRRHTPYFIKQWNLTENIEEYVKTTMMAI